MPLRSKKVTRTGTLAPAPTQTPAQAKAHVKMPVTKRPCVLVFAGHDPSGGAGIQADIEAIAAQGAHALCVITALTVQDNNQVTAVYPVASHIIKEQALMIIKSIPIAAIKIGLVGNKENADVIADIIRTLLQTQQELPVILDPVLGSGRGHVLHQNDPINNVQSLLTLATLLTPNLPEAQRLCPEAKNLAEQAAHLMQHRCTDVLIKGGHSDDVQVDNYWFHDGISHSWQWPRLQGEFHGSGCTLASAIAGQLAQQVSMQSSLQLAQAYTHRSLERAFYIADINVVANANAKATDQAIPQRIKKDHDE